MIYYEYSYHFYPVGQGLFSTGSIRRSNDRPPSFLWVYDCGTSSNQELIGSAIQQLKRFAKTRKRVDLLILSHFDKDHISGVIRLMEELSVGILMLPYMPLAQRLAAAFNDDDYDPNAPLTFFYLNPVRYILSQEQIDVGRILLVPEGGPDGPGYPGELQIPPQPDLDDELKLNYNKDESEGSEDRSTLSDEGRTRNVTVEFLKPGTSMVLSTVWEFVPYNVSNQLSEDATFLTMVERYRAALLSLGAETDRIDALKKIKLAYDSRFGARSKQRNDISLFLYSGPLRAPRFRSGSCYSHSKFCEDGLTRHSQCNPHWYHWPIDQPQMQFAEARCSILYTGDGYLNTKKKLQALIKYLDARRIRRICVLQVMHHGAKGNWHAGVAAAIAPTFSVFSSDPEHKRLHHPHLLVRQDFLPYGPVQVDKNVDFTIHGWIHWI